MAVSEFRPPGNPVLRHVLEIDLRIPLEQLLPGILRPIGRAKSGDRSVDWRQQSQRATWIVHEPPACGDGEPVMIKPDAIVEHRTNELVLVGSPVAAYATAILAAHVPCE